MFPAIDAGDVRAPAPLAVAIRAVSPLRPRAPTIFFPAFPILDRVAVELAAVGGRLSRAFVLCYLLLSGHRRECSTRRKLIYQCQRPLAGGCSGSIASGCFVTKRSPM